MRAFILTLFIGVASSSPLFGAQSVSIMTQNMDVGTNQSYILEFANSNPRLGVDLTLAEIVASNIPERANQLAARIAAEKPDIVGLQEAGLWRFGLTPATANFVLYDQLQLLLNALRIRGVPYRAIAVNSLTDIALPATVGAIRLTDRDALLVRADLPARAQVLNPLNHVFTASFPVSGFNILAGWISADVEVNGKTLQLVSTHLMSPIPGIPQATDVQVAQTGELLAALQGLPEPVIISGDLNSDANFGGGPDATPSVGLLESAGYTDDWKSVNPTDPGLTWPLFLQDQTPPNFFAASALFERIDLFFSQGITAVSEKRIIAPAPFTLPGYGSDHTGVFASFVP
jgi:endonuclease/exonuclease/phosphatase family metal-dependent hydrolase